MLIEIFSVLEELVIETSSDGLGLVIYSSVLLAVVSKQKVLFT